MIKNLHLKTMLLLCAMVMGIGSAWAETSTVTASKVASASATWTGSANETWSVAVNGGATNQNMNNGYAQVGTSSSPSSSITFTTSGISGTITSISVNCAAYQGKATVSATVGGAAFGTQSQATPSWTSNTGGDVTFTGSASGAILITMTNGTGGRAMYIKSITVTYTPSTNPSITASDVDIDYDETGGSIAFTVNNPVTDGVISASTEDSWITLGTETASPISFTCSANEANTERTATVTLTYTYGDGETATRDVTVTQAAYVDPNAPGTENNPYTVAQARAAIDAGAGTQSVYATGIVSAIPTAYSTEYSNITFNFVDNTGDQTFLQAYRCIGDEAANVQVGDIVVVSGNLTKYGSTYEFSQGCRLVSLTKSVAPVITAENVNIAYNATDGNIEYTIVNIPDPAGTLNASVLEGSWLTLGTVGESVSFTCEANTSATARTATVTLTYTYGNNQTATTDVTVTQAGAPTTASLPFEFDGGSAGIEETDGLTQDGLGDYSSSPKLKFDSTGDWLILNFNERPGKLTFDIKGNSFSGGTFKVQVSEDGETYTDLKTYTEISTTTQNEEFKNLGENVRYIKWIYTTRVSGNVALGNIALAKYKEPQSYTLTVSGLENVHLFVFDAAAQNDPLIAEGGNGSAQVVEETQVMISPDPAEGYTLKSLLVDGVDHKDDLGDDGSYTFTMPNKDITITATVSEIIPVETKTYTLATSITSGKHYVIASGTEDEVKVMGAQNSNNRAAANGTVSGTTLSVASDAGATEFVIYGPDAKGNYTIYDAANGYLYAASSSSNHLKSQLTNNDNGKWSISFDDERVASIVAQGTNTRNVMRYNSGSKLFSCYASGQQDIYLYEKEGETAPTETVHVTDAKYATYCSENALDFSNTGLTAYIAIMDGTTVSFEPVTKVPAYSGVLLKSDATGDFTVNVATTINDVTGNAFIGVTEETSNVAAGIFVLLNGEQGVGFYKTLNAFTVGAHTAYIPALTPTQGEARNFIAIDEATAIKAIESKQQSGEIYNLAGQRVKSAQKGLYIIDGKKVVIK